MSKKVVHLSDDAHELAKAHCKDSGMKMSDWVAMLIKRAVEPAPVVTAQVPPPAPVVRELPRPSFSSESQARASASDSNVHSLNGPKKKPMLRELSSEKGEDAVPVYAQPPFWARAKTS